MVEHDRDAVAARREIERLRSLHALGREHDVPFDAADPRAVVPAHFDVASLFHRLREGEQGRGLVFAISTQSLHRLEKV